MLKMSTVTCSSETAFRTLALRSSRIRHLSYHPRQIRTCIGHYSGPVIGERQHVISMLSLCHHARLAITCVRSLSSSLMIDPSSPIVVQKPIPIFEYSILIPPLSPIFFV